MRSWLDALQAVQLSGESAALVTVIRCKGSTPRNPGAKMLVLGDGQIVETIGGGKLEHLIIADALQVMQSGEAGVHEYPLGAKAGQCCGGWVEVFIEPINYGPPLYLYGAGHVGQALCRTLSGTPFRVTVIDPREEWLHSDAIPMTVTRFHGEWQDFNERAGWSSEVYAVIMTHRHDTDQEILEDLLVRQTGYLGLIGSRTKWQRFQKRLIAKGVAPERLSQIHCPIGIEIGGKRPQEVAVSTAAELIATYYSRPAAANTVNKESTHER